MRKTNESSRCTNSTAGRHVPSTSPDCHVENCNLCVRGHIALLKRKNVLWTCGICNTTLLDLRTPRYTHTRLTAFFPGLPRWAGTRKVKPIWILLKQETVSGSGISWAICKSALHSRQITTPAPHHSVFTGRMPFLLPNQQRQSTDGTHHVT